MFGRVMIIVAALVMISGCMQKPRLTKIPGGSPRQAVGYNTAGEIVRDGGRCASGTGGQSCTDKNGGQWYCQPGYACVRFDG